jgi:hypothetical protein
MLCNVRVNACTQAGQGRLAEQVPVSTRDHRHVKRR